MDMCESDSVQNGSGNVNGDVNGNGNGNRSGNENENENENENGSDPCAESGGVMLAVLSSPCDASSASSMAELRRSWEVEIDGMDDNKQNFFRNSKTETDTHADRTTSPPRFATSNNSTTTTTLFDFEPLKGDEQTMASCESVSVSAQMQLDMQMRVLSPELAVSASKLSAFRFQRTAVQIISIVRPVTALCLLALIYVSVIVVQAFQQRALIIRSVLLYEGADYSNPSPWSAPRKFGAKKFSTNFNHFTYRYDANILQQISFPGDSTTQQAVGSVKNAATVLAAVILATCLFLILFRLNARLCLLRLLQLFIVLALAVPWPYFLYELLALYSLAMDWITFLLISWNFVVIGVYALLVVEDISWRIHKVYLLCLSLSIAWPFTEFPEWSVWATLVALGVYDVAAVLTPWGPLKLIMDEEHHRQRTYQIYQRKQYTTISEEERMLLEDDEKRIHCPSLEAVRHACDNKCTWKFCRSQRHTDGGAAGGAAAGSENSSACVSCLALFFESAEASRGVAPIALPALMYRGEYFLLGLGDLVFYSVLSARAALLSVLTFITATLGILVGLAGTIYITAKLEARALPALPASILLGLTCFFITQYITIPFLQDCAVNGITAG